MGYQRHVAEFSASLRITVKNPAVYDDGAAYSIAQGKIDHSPVCILLPQFWLFWQWAPAPVCSTL